MTRIARYSLAVYAAWLAILSAQAQTQLTQPRLGMMLANDGSARPVYGVTSSITLGAAATGILSIGCSKTLCLLKTDSAIISPTGPSPTMAAAPAGPALFSFDGDSALIYFPSTRQITSWRADQLTPIDLNVDGEIVAISGTPSAPVFAVRNRAAVWIVAPGGTILESLPRELNAVLLMGSSIADGVLFAMREALILRRPGTADLQFEIAGVESLSWLRNDASGSQFIQVHTRAANFALRIDPFNSNGAGIVRLFQLPEPQP